MRLLLDECLDWRLRRDLPDHEIGTVKQLGWEHAKNGSLLRLAASQFDVFLTLDTKLQYQQNIATFDLAVVVLRGRTTRLVDLRELLPALIEALKSPRKRELLVLSWQDE